jgi:hypothetical protein
MIERKYWAEGHNVEHSAQLPSPSVGETAGNKRDKWVFRDFGECAPLPLLGCSYRACSSFY